MMASPVSLNCFQERCRVYEDTVVVRTEGGPFHRPFADVWRGDPPTSGLAIGAANVPMATPHFTG